MPIIRRFWLGLCVLGLLLGAVIFRHVASKTTAISDVRHAIEQPQAFISLGAKPSYAAIGMRIHQLGRNLPADEQRRLVHWMQAPEAAGFQADDPRWHWLVNEAMNSLCHQKAPLAEWSEVLIGFANDARCDLVIRDYAMQHMVDWLQPIASGEPCESAPKMREAMVNCLMAAASHVSATFAGTALLGLHHALDFGESRIKSINGGPAEPWRPTTPLKVGQLHTLAMNLVQSPEACDHARISALQVCAERGFIEALSYARKFATDSKLSDAVRMSAIAALGKLGSTQDTLLLDSLRKEKNAPLARAIEPANSSILHRTPSL